tara:strand:+ start:267 stop:548 length:282 start_codon:yes stop_codon:yes gene_type:complete
MKNILSSIEEKHYEKKAYSLKPVVIIGQNGLNYSVLDEINVTLNSHEPVKTRIRSVNKKDLHKTCLKIEQKLKAELMHQIGFIKVFYRVKPEN